MRPATQNFPTTFLTRRVHGGWGRSALEIVLPDASVAHCDADLWSGVGAVQIGEEKFDVTHATLENSGERLLEFSISHGFFCAPNVFITDSRSPTTFLLRQRRIWSSTIDMYSQDELVGVFSGNLLQSRNELAVKCSVPSMVAILSIWCILIRGAFYA